MKTDKMFSGELLNSDIENFASHSSQLYSFILYLSIVSESLVLLQLRSEKYW